MYRIIKLLKKIIQIILEDPKIIFGYDISQSEVEFIERKKKIPVQYLENLGGDNFFLNAFEKFNISKEDAIFLDRYLYSRVIKDFRYIRESFPCIVLYKKV